jgi:hypothetical protein
MSDTQPFKVSVEFRDGCLFATVEAEATDRELAPAYLKQILDEAVARGATRVLIERKIPAGIATTLVYSQIGLLDEMAKGMSLAIVDSDPVNYAHLERGIRFAAPESVRIKVFSRTDDALSWLQENE